MSPIFAGTAIKSQLVALVNRTEQRTLNPRVRGSSPWRRTRTDLGFTRFVFPREGRFSAMFAPRLLVSRDLVAAGASVGPRRTADDVTQREVPWLVTMRLSRLPHRGSPPTRGRPIPPRPGVDLRYT